MLTKNTVFAVSINQFHEGWAEVIMFLILTILGIILAYETYKMSDSQED
jgi:hypothetical protein